MKKTVILLIHALVGWTLCGATMGIGQALTTIDAALWIHAAAAPVIFGTVSWFYFRRFALTSPLVTATFFTAFVIGVDFFLVAMVFLKSFDMFRSPLGTWIPFALIFGSTWLAGRRVLEMQLKRDQ